VDHHPRTTIYLVRMFVRWVWSQAGVSPVPTSNVARAVGSWGVDHNLFKARPAGTRGGNPVPGDIAVFGPPDGQVGGHVAIVESVNADGTLTLINGNYNNKVAVSHVDPLSTRAGGDNVLISGYVSVPGA
jgi:hypothetical protein